MNETEKLTLQHRESKTFTAKSLLYKNELDEPINVLIKTSAGDTIDILLTSGSHFRLLPVGDVTINILGTGDNAIVDGSGTEHH